MGILEPFIGALLDEVKERKKPRKKLISAIKKLYKSLVKCQAAYLEIKPYLPEEGHLHYSLDKKDLRLIQNWRAAIGDLIADLWKLQDVLPIFAPKVASMLYYYVHYDLEEMYDFSIQYYGEGWGEYFRHHEEDVENFKKLVFAVAGADAIPIETEEYSADFSVIIEELQNFIRENFAMDEMY
jgi:hypothetical protein